MTISEARAIVRGEDAIRHQQWVQRDPRVLQQVQDAYNREYPGTVQIGDEINVAVS